MYSKPFLIFSSLLYKYAFPVYRILYFKYKNFHDSYGLGLLKKWVRQGDVVVDVGANLGTESIFLSKLVGAKGKVLSFEPEKVNYKHLKELTKKYSNIITSQTAISDKKGHLKIYTSSVTNVDHRTYPSDEFATSYKVKSTTLDTYIGRKFPVKLIKMDIQGFEFFALKGMTKTIKRNPDLIIFMEFWPVGLSKTGTSYKDIINFSKKHRLDVFIIRDKQILNMDSLVLRDYERYKNYDFDNWILTKLPRRSL